MRKDTTYRLFCAPLMVALLGVASACAAPHDVVQPDMVERYRNQENVPEPAEMLLNTDPEPDLEEGFESLFNGSDLTGWTPRGGTCRFDVRGDAIVGTCVEGSPSTYLSTERADFDDFIFTCEMKWEVNGNSGVMFRAQVKTNDAAETVFGPQVEMEGIVGDRRWSGGIYGQSCGGWYYPLWLEAHEAARGALRREGWNRLTLMAKGPVVKTWINGVPVAHWVDDTFERGFFGLQIHRGKAGTVHWRNLRVKELPPQRPNVLFIAIDDLRPELGCYGDTIVQSPHIDKLASQGMLFNRAYCQVAVCGASRASMMTGILPTKTRFVDHLARADEDVPNAVTMAQVFRNAGYTTWANGKIFHASEDTAGRSWSRPVQGPGMAHTDGLDPATTREISKRGRGLFYECVEAEDNAYGDGIVAEQTIADLRALKKSGEPFFLACGFIRPHLPFYAPKKYWDLYDGESIPLADNPYRPENAPGALRGIREYRSYVLGEFEEGSDAFQRKMRHGYFASTSYADKLTGDVLNELENLGLAGNTIVVVWGDHGWQLGEHTFWGKHNTTHNSIRVPLIIRAPGKPAGEISESLVASIDIFPTLCELAAMEVPDSVQGRSFAALLEEPDKKINNVVYNRFKAADAVVTDRFTYSLFENGEEMLYDLQRDPQENHNVAGNPEYSETLQRMREMLKKKIAKAESAP